MRVTYTDERRLQLEHVNAALNATIKPVEDQSQYGLPEYWAVAEAKGDCEDYALAKMKALRALGWPKESLDIAICKIPSGEAHAVLVARAETGDYVLDNLHSAVMRWDELRDYRWVMTTVNGSLKDWREVK